MEAQKRDQKAQWVTREGPKLVSQLLVELESSSLAHFAQCHKQITILMYFSTYIGSICALWYRPVRDERFLDNIIQVKTLSYLKFVLNDSIACNVTYSEEKTYC